MSGVLTLRTGGGAGVAEKGGRGNQTRDTCVGRERGNSRRRPATPNPKARVQGTGRAQCEGQKLLEAELEAEAGRRRCRATRTGPAGRAGPVQAKAKPGKGHRATPPGFWLVTCSRDGGTGSTLVLLPEKAPTTTTTKANDENTQSNVFSEAVDTRQ